MLRLAIGFLWMRKARSILCILAVMVCVLLNGSTATMNNWMYASMTSELARYMGKVYVQQDGSSYPPFESNIPLATAQAVLTRSDVGLNAEESAPVLFVRTERGMMPFMSAKSMVIGVPVGKEKALLANAEAASGASRFPATPGNLAILGNQAADNLNARVDDELTINGQTVRVAGVHKQTSMESVNIAAIVPLPTAQRLFGKEGLVSAVLVTARDVSNVGSLAASIKRDNPTLAVVTQDDMVAEAETVLRMPMVYMGVMSTMLMAVMERTREIGTLRAMGASRRYIVGVILTEIVTISLVGGIPGSLLTLPMANLMGTILPSPAQVSQIVVAAIGAGVLSGLYSAWRAARVTPIEALRYE